MAQDYLVSVTDEEGQTIQLQDSVYSEPKEQAFLFIHLRNTQEKANIGGVSMLSGVRNHTRVPTAKASCRPEKFS